MSSVLVKGDHRAGYDDGRMDAVIYKRDPQANSQKAQEDPEGYDAGYLEGYADGLMEAT